MTRLPREVRNDPDPRAPRFPVDLVQRLVPYLFCTPRVPGGRVLDVSAGSGAGPRQLASVAQEVHAYFPDRGRMEWERERHSAANLRYRVSGEDPEPEPGHYTAVCAFLVLERWKRPEVRIRHLRNLLGEEGELFLTAQSRRTVRRAGLADESSISPGQLESLLRATTPDFHLYGIHASTRVRRFWSQRSDVMTAGAGGWQRRVIPYLPTARRAALVGRLQERTRAELLRAGATSLAIEPDDFQVRGGELEDADHLLAVCR